MKQIMLAILAFALIANIASAMDAKIVYDGTNTEAPKNISLRPGESIDLAFKATNIYEVPGTEPALPVTIMIWPQNGGQVSDLKITGIPLKPSGIQVPVSSINEIYVPFSITNVNGPAGMRYRITVIAGNIETSLDFGSASRFIESSPIPEYSTIALPIAGLVGMMFLLSRKK